MEEVKEDLDRRRYFTPAQAIEYGLIDRVIQKGSDVFERKDYEAERIQEEAMRAGARPGAPSRWTRLPAPLRFFCKRTTAHLFFSSRRRAVVRVARANHHYERLPGSFLSTVHHHPLPLLARADVRERVRLVLRLQLLPRWYTAKPTMLMEYPDHLRPRDGAAEERDAD